ncbi:MAG: NAD-dependent deacylase [Chloroflexi bacterium]|nr:NAD-dependent deacylase [Chloroflexota bacterium]
MFDIPRKLIHGIKNAAKITVLTGAGVSAESGIPTFRVAQTGLWAKYDPSDLATLEAFRRNPRLVWNWYEWRRGLVRESMPNPAHTAIVEFEKKVNIFTLITQNVDGLHAKAGSQNIIELHGNILRTKCSENSRIVSSWVDKEEEPPRCPNCGAYLRPDVVWFGEGLPHDALELAVEASQDSEIFFSVGTSSIVQPAASLAVQALQSGALVVEVNPDETPLTQYANYALTGLAGKILPELVQQVWKED